MYLFDTILSDSGSHVSILLMILDYDGNACTFFSVRTFNGD